MPNAPLTIYIMVTIKKTDVAGKGKIIARMECVLH